LECDDLSSLWFSRDLTEEKTAGFSIRFGKESGDKSPHSKVLSTLEVMTVQD
jgi:hypothetical protein